MVWGAADVRPLGKMVVGGGVEIVTTVWKENSGHFQMSSPLKTTRPKHDSLKTFCASVSFMRRVGSKASWNP